MFPFVLIALYACGGMAAYDNIGGGSNTPTPDDTDPPDTDAVAETDEPAIDTGLGAPDGPDTALPPPVTGPGDTDPGNPSAPITLSDIVGTYTSGNNVKQTAYNAPLIGNHPCRGQVIITVGSDGTVSGNGACTWPLLSLPQMVGIGGYDEVMFVSFSGRVEANNPAALNDGDSRVTITDSTSSNNATLNGEFSRDGSGAVQLELWHNGRTATIGFASEGRILYRR